MLPCGSSIPSGLESLYIDANAITLLPAHMFSGPVALGTDAALHFGPEITYIAPGAFADIIGTVNFLYFAGNKISRLDASTFMGVTFAGLDPVLFAALKAAFAELRSRKLT